MATPVTSTAVKNTLNTISLSAAFTIVGAALPFVFSTFGTYGLIAAGVVLLCLLIQAYLPVGTAKAIEDGALTAIPLVEQLVPSLRATLEDIANGIKAAQAAPATTTTLVAETKTT